MRVGVEVGGTFTDLVAVEDGRVIVTKVPSTPRSPDVGAFNALTSSGIDLARIEDLGHGSTVATNAVLERKGARLGLLGIRQLQGRARLGGTPLPRRRALGLLEGGRRKHGNLLHRACGWALLCLKKLVYCFVVID